jgi:hypothetical protein
MKSSRFSFAGIVIYNTFYRSGGVGNRECFILQFAGEEIRKGFYITIIVNVQNAQKSDSIFDLQDIKKYDIISTEIKK